MRPKRTAASLVTSICALLILAAPSSADPLPGLLRGGFTSSNVEWVRNVRTQAVPEVGKLLDGYFYVATNGYGLTIFDVSEPLDPVEVGSIAIPHLMENEDIATNGEIALISTGSITKVVEPGYDGGTLKVIDVSDKSNPVEIASLDGAGDHTYECLLDCTWAYGGYGNIVDLRDPTQPVLLENTWIQGLELKGSSGHDVTEVSPGRVLTATNPMYLLDASDPASPTAIGASEPTSGNEHNVLWPRGGKDNFILSALEFGFPGNGRCEVPDAIDPIVGKDMSMKTWDASQFDKTNTIYEAGEYKLKNGTYIDGDPAFSNFFPWGCSPHYIDVHPKFHNGGLSAMASYSHGVKFLEIAKDGSISEVGWFLPDMGSPYGVFFVTDEIVYTTDPIRGIDILRLSEELAKG